MLIDTHSHLYDESFDGDREEVMARGDAVGVGRVLMPAIDSATHEAMFALARDHGDRCTAMMGLHPTMVNDNPRWREELELVERYLGAPPEGVGRFCAVGEAGLDMHWSTDWAREQGEVFERQIELALEHDLPLVLHSRDAWGPTLDMLRRFRGRGLRGVMHAYSGSVETYRQANEYGDFACGIGGVVTYKNSRLPEVVAAIARDHIVLETDCPYLTPEPLRGRRNESANLVYIRDRVAAILGLSPEDTEHLTTQNAVRIFRL
jgi:TatD DNase family protein